MKIIRRFSRISLISFSIKSYVNFRGTGILGFPLLSFEPKVVAIGNGQGCPLKQKKSIFYRGQKIYSLFIIYYELQQHQIYIRNKSANIMHSFIFSFFISSSFLQFQAFSLNSLFLIHLYY